MIHQICDVMQLVTIVIDSVHIAFVCFKAAANEKRDADAIAVDRGADVLTPADDTPEVGIQQTIDHEIGTTRDGVVWEYLPLCFFVL